MRIIAIIVILASLASGCDSLNSGRRRPVQGACPTVYWPETITIIPLTEFQDGSLKVYVDMVDRWSVRMKSPGVFRFELYEYTPRANVPTGRRLHIWNDIDMIDQAANNQHWRDFVRAYEFSLPLEPGLNKGSDYILQATLITPVGRRYTAQKRLTY